MQNLDEYLATLLARPEDDTARLAYAKALPEGDPRRRFILLQLKLAHILSHEGNADDWSRAEACRRESQALLAEHGEAWSAPLRPLVPRRMVQTPAERRGVVHDESVGFARGFVEKLKLPPRVFVEHAEELLKRTPLLHLQLSETEGLDALWSCPQLGRIRALSLANLPIGAAGMRALVASPHLRELRWLSVYGCKLAEEGLEVLCAAPNLPSLRWVTLGANGFTDPQESPGSVDGDWIYDWQQSDFGRELEKKHGRKEWLHFKVKSNTSWYPPDWQRLTGGRPEVDQDVLFPEHAKKSDKPAPRKAPQPAAKPEKAGRPLPWYYALNDRPIKFVETPEGGMDVLALNLRTGEFERDMGLLWVSNGKPFADIDQLDEAGFDRLVQMHRDDLPPKR